MTMTVHCCIRRKSLPKIAHSAQTFSPATFLSQELETRVVGSGSAMSNLPEDQEKITRILMTGMSDEQLRLIGQIAVIWNNNEFLFEKLIWRVAKWEPEVGALVTADLSSVLRETLAKNIIQKQV